MKLYRKNLLYDTQTDPDRKTAR